MKMNIVELRLFIWFAWLIAFVVFVIGFLSLERFEDIDKFEVREAAWTTAYMFIPVLVGLAPFWFHSNKMQAGKDIRPETHAHWIVISGTLVGLGVPGFYFFMFVLREPAILPEPGDGFRDVAAVFFKMLLLTGTLSITFANLVYNRDDLALGNRP